mgnify:CR=1 FL=1
MQGPDTMAKSIDIKGLMMKSVTPAPAEDENTQAANKVGELKAYLEKVTSAHKCDDTSGFCFRNLVQNEIGKVIDTVMRNQQRRPSYARILSRYSTLTLWLVLVLVVSGNAYFWSQTPEPVLFVYAGEVLTVAGLWWLFKWMNKAAVRFAPVTALIILLYKFMAFYLVAVLMLLGSKMVVEYTNSPLIIVLLCAVVVIVALVKAMDIQDKKDLRTGPVNGQESSLSDVINDSDVRFLSANPVIKQWIEIVIERRDTLTYLLLNNSRASILKFADEIMTLHEK